MTPFNEIIPAAPYRVLEAIWHQSIVDRLSDELFTYPYKSEDFIEIETNFKIRKMLVTLTGTELHFMVTDGQNHQADIFIQVKPLRKNESQVEYSIENSTLNGTQEKVLTWVLETISAVSRHYTQIRRTA